MIREPRARDAMRAAAEMLCEGWGCSARGHAPREVSALHRRLSAAAAETMGTAPAMGCALAPLYHADPWVAELTRAVMLYQRQGIAHATSLGRELTRADIDALAALSLAQVQAEAADAEARDEEQRRRDAEARAHAGGRGAHSRG